MLKQYPDHGVNSCSFACAAASGPCHSAKDAKEMEVCPPAAPLVVICRSMLSPVVSPILVPMLLLEYAVTSGH
jgi:hypothetical protein